MQSKILCVGNSHVVAVTNAFKHRLDAGEKDLQIDYIQLNQAKYNPWWTVEAGKRVTNPSIKADIQDLVLKHDYDATVLYMGGAAYFQVGHVDYSIPLRIGAFHGNSYVVPTAVIMAAMEARDSFPFQLIGEAVPLCPKPVIHISPPPPVSDEDYLLSLPGKVTELAREKGLVEANTRLQLWELYCGRLREVCRGAGILLLDCPPETLTPAGFLAPEAWGRVDPVHANAWFGGRQIEQVQRFIEQRNLP